MSDFTPRLPANPSLEQLRKQAKDLLRQTRASGVSTTLAEAQFAIARQYGFETWAKLKHHIESLQPSRLEQFERLADQVAAAYSEGNPNAIRELNWTQGTSFTWDHDPLKMQQHLPHWFASEARTPDLARADARQIVAHAYGFESWTRFAESASQPPADPRSAPVFLSSTPPFYKIDWQDNRLTAPGPQSDRDWDTLFALMEEHGIAKLSAGAMSDAAIAHLAELEQITHLQLGGAKSFTDEGAQHLARMPQLVELELGGWTSPLTDRALEPLRHLTQLRHFKSCWTQGISDAGLANLAPCELLEEVNVMGTPAGDGTIRALAGKHHLRRFRTGRSVTDAGLPLLHQFPVFQTWQGGRLKYELMSPDAEPNHLMLDGPFTDDGMAALQGLDGLFGLSFFWHAKMFTAAGLGHLQGLANLGFLGCEGERCDDAAMEQIARLPRLRMLMGQGTVATDAGFAALSRSHTLEYLWGRECPNLGGPGFAALANMPALRGLAVSCKNVDDSSLAALPRFPALRELMPMDVADAGFLHVGRCENLEGLWCMYCRDTGDVATQHIGGLSKLKTYYAGKTQITDRSLQILGAMDSLEAIEFWQCAGLTDSGIGLLVRLPRLRKLSLGGLSHVSRAVTKLFPTHVRVDYSG